MCINTVTSGSARKLASRTSTSRRPVLPAAGDGSVKRDRLRRARGEPASGLTPEGLIRLVVRRQHHAPAPRRLAREHHRAAVAVTLHGDERPRPSARARS